MSMSRILRSSHKGHFTYHAKKHFKFIKSKKNIEKYIILSKCWYNLIPIQALNT